MQLGPDCGLRGPYAPESPALNAVAQLLKEQQERLHRQQKRASNRVVAPIRTSAPPAGSNRGAQLLSLAAQPKPANAAKLIAGTWHYKCPQGSVDMWVDQRFFSPLELNKMKHLQPEDTPRNATIPRPNRQQRKSTAAPLGASRRLSASPKQTP